MTSSANSWKISCNPGSGPDVARVTNLGGLNKYYLDLTPYVDSGYWEQNYGATLPWFRAPGGQDKGIYGWMTQLTVTGPYVNVTMFDDAGVDMPGEGATWDDWMAALAEVKDALGIDAGRHGPHRPSLGRAGLFLWSQIL